MEKGVLLMRVYATDRHYILTFHGMFLMRCHIEYRDTCLACYVPDHRWIGVFVDNASTVGQVIDALADEWASDGFHTDGTEVTPEMAAAFEVAIEEMRRDNAKILNRFWDEDLPSSDDDETPSVWFTVHFEE
jgi:hypothetical protein